MPEVAAALTPGRLTRRLTRDINADAARLGVSPQTVLLACGAQVAERDFLLSLQADGRALRRRQAKRLAVLVRQFPFCAADAQAGAAEPRPVIPYAQRLRQCLSALCAGVPFFSMPAVSPAVEPASLSTIAQP